MKQNEHEVKGETVTETKEVLQEVKMVSSNTCSTEVKEKVLDEIYWIRQSFWWLCFVLPIMPLPPGGSCSVSSSSETHTYLEPSSSSGSCLSQNYGQSGQAKPTLGLK